LADRDRDDERFEVLTVAVDRGVRAVRDDRDDRDDRDGDGE
jgi:hypothetical protein